MFYILSRTPVFVPRNACPCCRKEKQSQKQMRWESVGQVKSRILGGHKNRLGAWLKERAWLGLAPWLWSCTGSHIWKGSVLGLMLYCHCLEILNRFWKRDPVFSFCAGPCKCTQFLVWGREMFIENFIVYRVKMAVWETRKELEKGGFRYYLVDLFQS